jgi:hypothetical protein
MKVLGIEFEQRPPYYKAFLANKTLVVELLQRREWWDASVGLWDARGFEGKKLASTSMHSKPELALAAVLLHTQAEARGSEWLWGAANSSASVYSASISRALHTMKGSPLSLPLLMGKSRTVTVGDICIIRRKSGDRSKTVWDVHVDPTQGVVLIYCKKKDLFETTVYSGGHEYRGPLSDWVTDPNVAVVSALRLLAMYKTARHEHTEELLSLYRTIHTEVTRILEGVLCGGKSANGVGVVL